MPRNRDTTTTMVSIVRQGPLRDGWLKWEGKSPCKSDTDRQQREAAGRHNRVCTKQSQ